MPGWTLWALLGCGGAGGGSLREDTALIEQIVSVEQPAPAELTDCPESLDLLPEPLGSSQAVEAPALVVVFKRPYKLGLYQRGRLVHDGGVRGCFPISMGVTPFEPKRVMDFSSTPEGWYTVAERRSSDPADGLPSTRYGHALLISYPSLQDVREARRDGLIDEHTAQGLLGALEAGRLPSQTSAMGGSILIHEWATGPAHFTEGCVGVDREPMRWLFGRVAAGAPILILPWRLVLREDGSWARDERAMEPLDEAWRRELGGMFEAAARDERGRITLPELLITGDPPPPR
ncbi:MAG: L,D-transpeptidase [Deltaproteobacteria bacterium]|nr:L,D-transpeptidase [Deltaproteobacteria bacterium]